MTGGKQRRSDEEFIQAAVSMVDRYGSADPGLGYTMVAAAELAGVGRQTLYHHWSSITDLTADIVRHGVMVRPGWCHRLIATDPSESAAAAIQEAIQIRDLSPVMRAVASAWPLDHPARRDLVDWERAWFDVLGQWIEARLHQEGRVLPHGGDPVLAAVALTAWADGNYFLANWFTGPHLPTWLDPALHEGDLERGLAWFDRVFPASDPAAAPPSTPAPRLAMPTPRGPELGDAQRRIIDALIEGTGAPPADDRPGPVPGRVVDLARLARELEVTERSLYNRWPQVADLNGDVFEHMLHRVRRESEERLGAALKLCWEQQFTSYDQLMISGLGAMIDATASRAPFTHFAMVVATLDDEVREPSAQFVRDWVDSLSTSFLAIMAVTGFRVEDDHSIRKLMMPLFSTVLGLQRIACMHPDLASATHTFRGREVPALAFAVYLYLMGAITDAPFVRQADSDSAPPLPDLDLPEVDGLAG